MFQSFKKFVVIVAALMSFATVAYAEASDSEKSVSGFFRRLFGYPVKAVQNTGSMTANTLNNAGEKIVAKTGENTAEVLSGQLDQTPAIVGDAAMGTLETTGQTAAETVQVPVKSAEEDEVKK